MVAHQMGKLLASGVEDTCAFLGGDDGKSIKKKIDQIQDDIDAKRHEINAIHGEAKDHHDLEYRQGWRCGDYVHREEWVSIGGGFASYDMGDTDPQALTKRYTNAGTTTYFISTDDVRSGKKKAPIEWCANQCINGAGKDTCVLATVVVYNETEAAYMQTRSAAHYAAYMHTRYGDCKDLRNTKNQTFDSATMKCAGTCTLHHVGTPVAFESNVQAMNRAYEIESNMAIGAAKYSHPSDYSRRRPIRRRRSGPLIKSYTGLGARWTALPMLTKGLVKEYCHDSQYLDYTVPPNQWLYTRIDMYRTPISGYTPDVLAHRTCATGQHYERPVSTSCAYKVPKDDPDCYEPADCTFAPAAHVCDIGGNATHMPPVINPIGTTPYSSWAEGEEDFPRLGSYRKAGQVLYEGKSIGAADEALETDYIRKWGVHRCTVLCKQRGLCKNALIRRVGKNVLCFLLKSCDKDTPQQKRIVSQGEWSYVYVYMHPHGELTQKVGQIQNDLDDLKEQLSKHQIKLEKELCVKMSQFVQDVFDTSMKELIDDFKAKACLWAAWGFKAVAAGAQLAWTSTFGAEQAVAVAASGSWFCADLTGDKTEAVDAFSQVCAGYLWQNVDGFKIGPGTYRYKCVAGFVSMIAWFMDEVGLTLKWGETFLQITRLTDWILQMAMDAWCGQWVTVLMSIVEDFVLCQKEIDGKKCSEELKLSKYVCDMTRLITEGAESVAGAVVNTVACRRRATCAGETDPGPAAIQPSPTMPPTIPIDTWGTKWQGYGD